MDWTAFLNDRSDRWRLTLEQSEVLLARLADENLDKSETEVALQLCIGSGTIKKRMGDVYKAAGKEFQSVAEKAGRGKFPELRGCLKTAYREEMNVQVPIAQPEVSLPDSQEPIVQPEILSKSGMKPGAPLPGVRLPDNFVARTGALKAVKGKLLAEDDRTLVVSAIEGLGGLGKSVLATAVVLDEAVQGRFEDGILWVTLGQNPDLLSCLGDLIRVLDKSRDAFSANTVEAASRYLGTLLADRRMLLVVDDVWNAAHAVHFQVGGGGCRVLVTTREARVAGADYYDLDLMSEGEAIALVQGKLGAVWKAGEEGEFRAFARSLGYLPLGLDLAAMQVSEGMSWRELRSEFEVERRSVAVGLLDSSEAFEHLSEEEQRRYSLRACFNLSLKRLNDLQLEQFAWLGVLPEDVSLTVWVGMRLWDLSAVRAKRVLMDLRSRSFLTDGPQTFEGERTYRVHDLMHDMAKDLIEEGTLVLPILNSPFTLLNCAHRSFLNQYRKLGSWNELPIEDLYIFRHLT